MNRILSICLLLFFTHGLLNNANADGLDRIIKRGELIVGVKDFVPPSGFRDLESDQLIGYEIDIAKEIANRIGVRFTPIIVNSNNRIQKLIKKQIDLIAASMSKTERRENFLLFSHSYFVTGQKVMIRSDSGFRKLSDLKGQEIISIRGSNWEQNARRSIEDIRVESYNNAAQAFQNFNEGKTQGITTDEILLIALKQSSANPKKYIILDELLSHEAYGLGVNLGEIRFLEKINVILFELEVEGFLDQIFKKWFGPKTSTPIKKRNFRVEQDLETETID